MQPHVEELRERLLGYLSSNPMSIRELSKDIGIHGDSLGHFIQNPTRKVRLTVYSKIRNYLDARSTCKEVLDSTKVIDVNTRVMIDNRLRNCRNMNWAVSEFLDRIGINHITDLRMIHRRKALEVLEELEEELND